MLFFFLPLFQNEFNTGYYWIILKPRRQEEKFKKKYALGIGSIPAACYINTQSFKTKNETTGIRKHFQPHLSVAGML